MRDAGRDAGRVLAQLEPGRGLEGLHAQGVEVLKPQGGFSVSRIKKFGRDWAIFQNPDKPEVILTRGGIAIATIYPGPMIGPEQAMREAAWANAVLIGEAVAALQHAEGRCDDC